MAISKKVNSIVMCIYGFPLQKRLDLQKATKTQMNDTLPAIEEYSPTGNHHQFRSHNASVILALLISILEKT